MLPESIAKLTKSTEVNPIEISKSSLLTQHGQSRSRFLGYRRWDRIQKIGCLCVSSLGVLTPHIYKIGKIMNYISGVEDRFATLF